MMAAPLILNILFALALQPSLGLELHPFLSDNIVLARAPLSARLWGWGSPKEHVSVVLDGSAIGDISSVSDDGAWTLNLPLLEASAGPHSLTVSGSQSGAVTLSNVAFGDVFLCSGQSNMQFAVNGAFNATEEIADSVNYPNLRLANVGLVPADTPQTRVTPTSGCPYTWAVSGPAAFPPPDVNNIAFSWPSAACYFFGRDLYKNLGGRVPIGLVTAAWGGQTIETFSSPDAIADKTCGGTEGPSGVEDTVKKEVTESMKVAVEASTAMFRRLPSTSQLWNGMIHPLINMRFAGAVWYQGESNAGDPSSYACHFPAMIADWRRKMDLRLPFYFVQLAAFTQNYADIRNAQMDALKLPDVYYAVAIDLGDPQSPFGAIHPRRKQEVGRRLALAALGGQYGTDVVSTGPVVRGAIMSSVPPHNVLVGYVPGTADELHAHGTAACTDCCRTSPFEVRSATSGNWSRAELTVYGSRVALAIPRGVVPAEVRYNWEGYPQCSLYNGEGGPDDHKGIAATPFHVEVQKVFP